MPDRYDDEASRLLDGLDEQIVDLYDAREREPVVDALAAALREAHERGAREMRARAAERVEAMVPDASESRFESVRKATDWIAAWVTATAHAVRALPIDDAPHERRRRSR